MSQISAELQRARSEVDCIRSYSFAARPIESLILEWSSQSAASDRCACVYPLISTRQASVRASQLILFISLLRTAVFKSLDCFSFFFFLVFQIYCSAYMMTVSTVSNLTGWFIGNSEMTKYALMRKSTCDALRQLWVMDEHRGHLCNRYVNSKMQLDNLGIEQIAVQQVA